MQHTLKKAIRGNIKSADKFSNNIGIENTSVSDQLMSRLLKVVKIIIYNIDI